MARVFEFKCAQCGEIHNGSPSVAYGKPEAYFDVPNDELDQRVTLDSDICTIDNEQYYIRGILEVPIHGADEPFTWGVWVSQSEESFNRYCHSYNDNQSAEGSFGWLTASMPGYNATDADGHYIQLACNVLWQEEDQRPVIEPQECAHQLYLDFAGGITWDRAIEIAGLIMHPD